MSPAITMSRRRTPVCTCRTSTLRRIPRPPQSTLFPYTTLFRSNFKQRTTQLLWFTVVLLSGATTMHAQSKLNDVAVVVDRKSTRLNSSHANISYAVFCLTQKSQRRDHGVQAFAENDQHDGDADA